MNSVEEYFGKPMHKITDDELCQVAGIIPYGYCHCGCGQKTKFPKRTDNTTKRKKGIPMQYIHGHNNRLDNPAYKGGYYNDKDSYTMVLNPGHPRANHRDVPCARSSLRG